MIPRFRENKGRKYEPPKQPSRIISSGLLLGKNVGWSSKWKTESSSRVGGDAFGFHAVQLARMASMSLIVTAAFAGSLPLSFSMETGGFDLFLFRRGTSSVLSFSLYDGVNGAEAIRADDREGGRCSSFRFLVGADLVYGLTVFGGAL